jgi:hypothetical protein
MRCATTWFCIPLLAALASGQAITGTVVDPDGKGVPLAPMQALNPASGMTYKTTTADDGSFSFAQLPAGAYDISIPPIGFTFPKFERKGVAVQAGQTLRLELRLSWGGNLGTPGDDISSWVRNKGRPSGLTPRTPDGKPDFSGVWIGNSAEGEDAALLPWADALTKERRARGGGGNPGESCLPGDILLVNAFVYKVIQTRL